MNVIKHFKNIFYRENELSRPGGGPYGNSLCLRSWIRLEAEAKDVTHDHEHSFFQYSIYVLFSFPALLWMAN